MANEELKKKIAQIIADYFCPQGNEHKKLWGDDRLCYSKMNFTECERIAECTDALIAAGIGDVKRHRVFVSKDGKEVKQFYSGEEVENIVKERNELKVELRDKVDYIHEQDEVIKEYKHRAARAERALVYAVSEYRCDECPCVDCNAEIRGSLECIDCICGEYKKQAEKELAEEGKDG